MACSRSDGPGNALYPVMDELPTARSPQECLLKKKQSAIKGSFDMSWLQEKVLASKCILKLRQSHYAPHKGLIGLVRRRHLVVHVANQKLMSVFVQGSSSFFVPPSLSHGPCSRLSPPRCSWLRHAAGLASFRPIAGP